MKKRKSSLRLKGYDYTQPGAYFVTACSHQRKLIFGEVVEGMMRLNQIGKCIQEEWFCAGEMRQEIMLYPEEFIVMPNHIHGIVWIEYQDVTQNTGMPIHASGIGDPIHDVNQQDDFPRFRKRYGRSLGAFIAGFKAAVTTKVKHVLDSSKVHLWQRGYYDRIIRNTKELDAVRAYIIGNPHLWAEDKENPIHWM